jgi:hypothetical protein
MAPLGEKRKARRRDPYLGPRRPVGLAREGSADPGFFERPHKEGEGRSSKPASG